MIIQDKITKFIESQNKDKKKTVKISMSQNLLSKYRDWFLYLPFTIFLLNLLIILILRPHNYFIKTFKLYNLTFSVKNHYINTSNISYDRNYHVKCNIFNQGWLFA